jgi:arsenical pump membrane protein
MAALISIMVMTGVVRETGAFERLAFWLESYARRTTPLRAFQLVFVISVVTPTLLNNDSAILLLTPLVIPLAKRLYPTRRDLWEAFAFAVFFAPGVAPFVISNPMNMIVAEFAGIGFNDYSRIMAPVSLLGALLTYAVLRLVYAKSLAAGASAPGAGVLGSVPDTVPAMAPPGARHPAETPALALLLAVFAAYPVMAALGGPIWVVSVTGAFLALGLSLHCRVASMSRVTSHVSPDILLFLWGSFLVVTGLKHVGVVANLASVYDRFGHEPGAAIAVIGTLSALGSAVLDNHPMALLNMMALDGHHEGTHILASLVGGDLGPRLLPIGSLAGLLWLDLARRGGLSISSTRFLRIGACTLLPTLVLSLAMLVVQSHG